MDEQRQRLQGIYAAMSDDELLRMVGAKAGLTEVAQQAVDAEVSARGLVVAVDEAPEEVVPEVSDAEGDPSLIELMTFAIAADADTAARVLDERGIPIRMEQAMRRMVEGGPKVKTNWLTIFVERTRKDEAVVVLRQRMGLFPVLAADEIDDSDGAGDEEALFPVGEFDVEADVDVAVAALTEAGIWFKATKVSQEAQDGQPAFEGTVIETRLEDLEQSVAVVGAAFGDEA